MFKVKVKDMPVFYAGNRYLPDDELEIKESEDNTSLFEIIEKTENIPFKGVKEIKLRKALENAGIEVPEDSTRENLIKLMLENDLTI
ncbi:conjugal transfer protein [Enterococcus faecalis]|uniref:conjugal transfer protein n=1 Tax=Enterococcus faecalis TaxID=1351 RepID=UPI0019FFC513|nr:conjugal transfer protein [Enterococcus faecalis]EIB6805433.1 conjugal transfer protein [Enterococcus faecalis]